MNRSEKRRQKKLAGKAAPSPGRQGSALEQVIDIAVAQHTRGQLTQAGKSYRKILQADPDQPVALHLLGVIAHQQGRSDDAVDLMTRAVSVKPDYLDAHNNLGKVHNELGNLEAAAASFEKALAIGPDANPYNNLGIVYAKLGRQEDAVASFQNALAITPGFAEAHNNLGTACLQLGKLAEAAESFKAALAINPENSEAHNGLGSAWLELERPNEAIACFQAALTIRPDFIEAHCNLAEALETTNRTEALREALNVARRNCPDHPLLSLCEAQLLKRDGDIETARAGLEATGADVADDSFLMDRAYLLGELCDRTGDSEAAYNYFKEGNRRCKDSPRAKQVDGGRYLTRIDVLAKRYTSGWIAGWRDFKGNEGRPDPVFLLGFPRSGTTLLDTILHSHPGISITEERPTIRKVRNALERLPGGDPDGLAELDGAQIKQLRDVYFAELDKHLDPNDTTSLIVDKNPLNTVEAGLIHRIFPHARFLFVQRHPCDCVLSCFMQNFDPNDAMINFLDLESAAHLYDGVMTLWQQYREVLPLVVHTVRYETLIEAFEETLNLLLEFLGVDWDDGIRNYIKTAHDRGQITTASYNQVTQPLYTRARGRWQRYHEQMAPVLPTLLPWARHFGYDA